MSAAPLFAALGDETRLRLVTRLCEQGPQPTARLTEGAAISRQALAKHLRALEEAGLVRSSGSGRGRVWAVRAGRLEEARRYLDRISAQWDQALGRLKDLVERDEG